MGVNPSFLRSSIGKKYAVAITGSLLVLFLLAHLVGNLQMFLGQDAINQYAVTLRKFPAVLWVARIGLLTLFFVHLSFALSLWRTNNAARPVSYAHEDTVQATTSSRVMILSGVMILLYVVGHLLHLTFQLILPETAHFIDAQGRHDVYKMVVLGFQNPVVSISYIVAMLVLCSHLSHGISSVFQTFGCRSKRNAACVEKIGPILATIIALGYISIPVAVLLGIISLPQG